MLREHPGRHMSIYHVTSHITIPLYCLEPHSPLFGRAERLQIRHTQVLTLFHKAQVLEPPSHTGQVSKS